MRACDRHCVTADHLPFFTWFLEAGESIKKMECFYTHNRQFPVFGGGGGVGCLGGSK